MDESTEKVKERLLALIEADFGSDAAFERAAQLPPKTVNNWRRGASASFIKMMPRLAAAFKMSVGELAGFDPEASSATLSEEEERLVGAYRRARTLPAGTRQRLLETLTGVIDLCVAESAPRAKRRVKSTEEAQNDNNTLQKQDKEERVK